MKHILTILCLIGFTTMQAQEALNVHADSIKKGLSYTELLVAKKKYIEMMKSDTYIQNRENITILNEKLNGVELFSIDEIVKISKGNNGKTEMHHYEEFIRKRLAENINKTKFVSVDEGVEFHVKYIKLYVKELEENAQLYALMRKATSEQLSEIMRPERDRALGRMLDAKYDKD